MNSTQFSSLEQNPFTRPAFWGRRRELQTIYSRLLTDPPQCCALVGENYIGKTTLMRYISEPQNSSIVDDLGIKHKFSFVYLDCSSYIDLATDDHTSVLFWWDLYRKSQNRLQPNQTPRLTETIVSINDHLIDTAFEIKSELEVLVQAHQDPVIFVLDNFESIARLPLRNSEWLRAMALHHCAYIVSSRHLLYLLYQYHLDSWAKPSPFWNLFSDPIYLGLMSEDEVWDYLEQAMKQAEEFGSVWNQRDIDFIRMIAGRHAELIRIACMHLFKQCLQSRQSADTEKDEFLKLNIYKDAGPICSQLWLGLADHELSGEPVILGYSQARGLRTLSRFQKGLIDVAKRNNTSEKEILFVLDQRGLIERVNGEWQVFSEVMRQFALKQEKVYATIQANSDKERPEALAFTHLEDRVYKYLKLHTGEVCDRDAIKSAVWENNPPTDSALQKIIERIREKIEPDPNNPRYLIAVRGQGFMLREDLLD